MMPDIFSAFDPMMYKSFIPSIAILLSLNMLLIPVLINHMHPMKIRVLIPLLMIKETIYSQLSRTQSKFIKGLSIIVTTMFISIILVNLLGMTPYFFSLSSHLIMTLSLGLPVWLSLIMSSFMKLPKSSTAHFLPDGAPDWLNPFLVLIETTSVLVRPLTLSFRLAANMTAGHIVLGLISIYSASALLSSLKSSLILIPVSMGYILFEFAICLI